MSKTKKTKDEQPSYIAELLKNGTATLTASTPEELAMMVNDIPTDCSYGSGACGFNPETREYSLRIDITNK